MDVELEWFTLCFERAMLKKRGSEFQDFFANLMEAAHPGDFEKVRAYGKKGDLKCDGLLKSTGRIFQVYAPRETKESVMVAKIATDFKGAKTHWKAEMRGWSFVHNDDEGLPPAVVKKIDAVQKANAKLGIETWGHERLKSLLTSIPRTQLVTLFGRPPSRSDFDRLTFAPVAKVLLAIRCREVQGGAAIDPVSPTKLEANALNAAVADYLRLGRHREHLVQLYLEAHVNPTLGEEIASAFRAEYGRLRHDGLEPNDVFVALQEFTGGSTRGDTEHETAVLAVLSYLFERCDIFEPPPPIAAS